MNRSKFKTVLFSILFLPAVIFAQDPIDLLKKFSSSVDKNTCLQYVQKSQERISKKGMVDQYLELQVKEGPNKIVNANVTKPKSAKLWYEKNARNGNVKTNKLGLILHPLHSQLMADSQHPITNAGFMVTRSIIYRTYKERANDPAMSYAVNGSVNFDGKDCYKITIEDAGFNTSKSYTAKEGENLVDIGKKLNVSHQRIKELNNLKSYKDVEAGEKLKVPSSYFKKVITYLDKSTFLPLKITVYDDLGMLATYDHLGLKVDCNF